MYVLADLNKFYVSILRVFMPELEGVPVIVRSNNDGPAICASRECDKFGLSEWTDIIELERLIKLHNIQWFSVNFPLIADMSLRVKSIIRRFCDNIEDYSIDEMFLEFKGLSAEEVKNRCDQIVKIIQKGLGLPISLGIAPTKTLAKLACRFAKKHKGYDGVCLIDIGVIYKRGIFALYNRLERTKPLRGIFPLYGFVFCFRQLLVFLR